eukprot:CAMPEP_0175233796 /NCGR_PEP_ID=MMETSP0093-20121207/26651_1 /TAXON_ID=311494 /ORGANISM="Alexandrium monilatum, Strain CCMP3105" /LENGTH=70 /DNA_ID=CAMNT_0016527679 /DNA_START=5 /DNA_END=214 /DNA_ORIENTATION=+
MAGAPYRAPSRENASNVATKVLELPASQHAQPPPHPCQGRNGNGISTGTSIRASCTWTCSRVCPLTARRT